MNTIKINELKQVAQTASQAYESEKARLTAAGFKSAERYVMLKDLKAVEDAACSALRKFSTNEIKKELNKIIREDAPARAAAARARSPWKQAKFDAANK